MARWTIISCGSLPPLTIKMIRYCRMLIKVTFTEDWINRRGFVAEIIVSRWNANDKKKMFKETSQWHCFYNGFLLFQGFAKFHDVSKFFFFSLLHKRTKKRIESPFFSGTKKQQVSYILISN